MIDRVILVVSAALLASGCDDAPIPTPVKAPVPSPVTSASTGAVLPVPAPKRVAMSELDPPPRRVRFGMVTMGKGPVDQYEIELDLERWALSGRGRWDEKSYDLPKPAPLSSAQREALEPSLDAMRLVTDGPAECKKKKDDPTIYCGSDTSVDVDGETYSDSSSSCQYVDYPADADPHEAVGKAFRALAEARGK